MKTLLVGLDAACWAYLDPLLDAGRMPNLQKLMNSGSWGVLQSTLPAATPVAWASIITGKNPGKHGVFDMMWHRPNSYELSLTHAGIRRGTPFWQRLNEQGIRVGIINAPFTHPPQPVEGFILCGFGTGKETTNLSYPADLLQQVESQFGPYDPIVNPTLYRNGEPAEVLAAEEAHQTGQVAIAIEMAKRYEVEVLVMNLMLPDHANHKMPVMSQVEQALCSSDADVGRLIEGFQPDNVMLISDHGSRRLKGDFLLSGWLRDHGYAKWQERKKAADRTAALNWVLNQWLEAAQGRSGLSEKLPRRLLRGILPYLPAKMADRFWNHLETAVPMALDHVHYTGKMAYKRSRLYFGNRSSGVIYLNVEGRDPDGIISPDERCAFAAEIKEQLENIPDPESGLPILSGVYTREALYTGPFAEYAPDLVLDGYSASWNICTPYRRQAKAEASFGPYLTACRDSYGWHSRDGIFAFAGKDFSGGHVTDDRHVMDVPATLLHLYGVPIPEDMDGRVMTETFLSPREVTFQPGDKAEENLAGGAYSVGETEEILSHLRALGYVD
ncbi:MAG: alkaline phosphatase family protein [Candidatus Promineifilaceae bacterium]